MTFIGSWFSLGSPNLNTVVMCGDIPPAVSSSFMYIDTHYRYPKGLRIFVPDKSLETYRDRWASYNNDAGEDIISFLHPMSEYHG